MEVFSGTQSAHWSPHKNPLRNSAAVGGIHNVGFTL